MTLAIDGSGSFTGPRGLIHGPSPHAITLAVEALAAGQLVGLPTETVYGLASRGDDPAAIAKIYAAKRRPSGNPLILHVATAESARSLLAGDAGRITLARLDRLASFWPGPLTLIGPKAAHVPDAVTAGGPTVAIRVPDHPVTLQLLGQVPFPVAAPSANVSNYVSPTTAGHVADGLGHAVAMILDGGPCRIGLESTIVQLGDADRPAMMLRRGGIGVAAIESALGETIQVAADAVRSPDQVAAAPGQFARHYSPRTPCVLVDAGQDSPASPGRVLRIHLGPPPRPVQGYAQTWVLSSTQDAGEIARRLYESLRRADGLGVDSIEIDVPPDEEVFAAIRDRLSRAASQR